MKWFKKWINRMNNEGRDILEEEAVYNISETVGIADIPYRTNGKRGLNSIRQQLQTAHVTSPSTHSINFQIYPATGGYVAEINFYDENTDSNVRSLHVIPNTDLSELGDHISKIITIEMLKR
jgi:hypothetical protein